MNQRLDDVAQQKFRQEEEQSKKEGNIQKLRKGEIKYPINKIMSTKGDKDRTTIAGDVGSTFTVTPTLRGIFLLPVMLLGQKDHDINIC